GTRYRLSFSFCAFLRRWLRRLGFVPRAAASAVRLISGAEVLERALPQPGRGAQARPLLPSLEAFETRNYPNDLLHLAFLPLTAAAAPGLLAEPARREAAERRPWASWDGADGLSAGAWSTALPLELAQMLTAARSANPVSGPAAGGAGHDGRGGQMV